MIHCGRPSLLAFATCCSTRTTRSRSPSSWRHHSRHRWVHHRHSGHRQGWCQSPSEKQTRRRYPATNAVRHQRHRDGHRLSGSRYVGTRGECCGSFWPSGDGVGGNAAAYRRSVTCGGTRRTCIGRGTPDRSICDRAQEANS